MDSIVFTPYEMESLRPKNKLEWASDFLYQRVMDCMRDNKETVLTSLRTRGHANVFHFECVEWRRTARDEKKYLKTLTRQERREYMEKKQQCMDEIQEECYQHSIWRPESTVSVRAVLHHTDLMTRINAACGSMFEVAWTSRLAKNSPRIDFDLDDPQYMVLDCTIEIQYLSEPKSQERLEKCRQKYMNHFPETENVYLLNQPVRRHLKFYD